jgi:hypothetical protein
MTQKHTKGEMHGCIVCGRLYQLYVLYDEQGRFVDCKVMTAGGKRVAHSQRALVACESHSPQQIETAVAKAYGKKEQDD